MIVQHIADAAAAFAGQVLAHAPTPDPTTTPGVPGMPAPKPFTGAGVVKFLAIMLQIGGAVLGVIFIFKARKGDLSATMSSGAVFLIGILLFVGSTTFVLLSITTGLLDFVN
jgi:hypothetical protein